MYRVRACIQSYPAGQEAESPAKKSLVIFFTSSMKQTLLTVHFVVVVVCKVMSNLHSFILVLRQ